MRKNTDRPTYTYSRLVEPLSLKEVVGTVAGRSEFKIIVKYNA